MGLNSLWGAQQSPLQDVRSGADAPPLTEVHTRILRTIVDDVTRLKEIQEVTEDFEWNSFFRTRTIDYKGDEVKAAQMTSWANVRSALPSEVGTVPLSSVVSKGSLHYVLNF